MKSRIFKIIAIFSSVILMGSHAMAKTDLEKDIEAGAQTMTQSEMFKLFENNTITGFNAQTDKLHGKSYFPKDKKVISLKKGQKKKDRSGASMALVKCVTKLRRNGSALIITRLMVK
ncbi:MAG: hypothetical protein CBB97_00575 [Candidatus Endolissoclinum sp. TMED37]|nr:MAG: hypothetical protein CBB97_00575 [Candidatus Endolissoclinum sp. TMED37]